MKTIDELRAEIENLSSENKIIDRRYSSNLSTMFFAENILFEKKYPNLFSKYRNQRINIDLYEKYLTKYNTEISNKFNELVEYGKQRKAELLNEISSIERQIKIEDLIYNLK